MRCHTPLSKYTVLIRDDLVSTNFFHGAGSAAPGACQYRRPKSQYYILLNRKFAKYRNCQITGSAFQPPAYRYENSTCLRFAFIWSLNHCLVHLSCLSFPLCFYLCSTKISNIRPIKNWSFSTILPSSAFWLFEWHRCSGPCSNVCYLGHCQKYMFIYLLTRPTTTTTTTTTKRILTCRKNCFWVT